MTNENSMLVYIGVYPNVAAASGDGRLVEKLYGEHLLGSYDSAVISKDDNGHVHVNKDEMAARHGAWGGAVVGAVVGLLFPPSLLGFAIVGAGIGGLSGHLWRGLSRADVKDLGEIIDGSEAALIVVADSQLSAALEGATLHADRQITRVLAADWADIDLDGLRAEPALASV
jgi:uncharacterized membrane protein